MQELDDPYIMYFVIRNSLNMSPPKLSVQIAHACEQLMLHYFNILTNSNSLYLEPNQLLELQFLFKSWIDSFSTKVVLTANDSKFEKLKEEFKNKSVLIVDLGKTEIPPNSETCLGLFPMRKSLAPKSIKRLQLLK